MCEEFSCGKLPWMIDFYSTQNGRVPSHQLKAAYAKNSLKHAIKLNVESLPPLMRLTRIMCSIGDVSGVDDKLYISMMDAGMSMALLKTVLQPAENWRKIVKNLRDADDMYSRRIGRVYPLGIALELRGTEIRTGVLKNSSYQKEIQLEKGNKIALTTDPAYEEHVTDAMIYVDYQKMPEIVTPGDNIYLDNKINLSAMEIVGNIINCIIETAGILMNRASVSIPDIPIEVPVVPLRDEEDILAAINDKIDAIVVPGLQTSFHIKKYREILGTNGQYLYLIAKIDSANAVENIDEVIEHSDGLMLDRAALALEISQEKLFLVQKSIIAKCNLKGKPIICGPNMLDSMVTLKRPSNADSLDVSNAILDGVDCLLLSREIFNVQNVVNALKALDAICREAEAAVYQKDVFNNLLCNTKSPIEVVYSIGIAAVETACKCQAAAIIVLTVSGKSARIISRFKPRCPIIAITSHIGVARQLQFYRALDPLFYIRSRAKSWKEDAERRIQLGVTYGKCTGFIRGGDAIVVASGTRPSSGFTNYIKVVYASEFDTVPNECVC